MKEQNVEKSEFELGDEVTELVERPRRKPGVVISVRLEADDAKRLFALAERRDQTVSDVAREAIHSYLFGMTTGHVPPVTFYFAGGPAVVFGPGIQGQKTVAVSKTSGTPQPRVVLAS